MRGVAAERSAQRACERSSDWRRGARSAPPTRRRGQTRTIWRSRSAPPTRRRRQTRTIRSARSAPPTRRGGRTRSSRRAEDLWSCAPDAELGVANLLGERPWPEERTEIGLERGQLVAEQVRR